MAGRPAGPGAPSGLLYGVIAFAIVSVASLGLFIFQLTRNKAAENRATIAEQKLGIYGTPPAYYADEASSRKSKVFAVMADDIQKLAGIITGSPKDVGAVVVARTEQTIADIAQRAPGTISSADALLTAVATLSEMYAQAKAGAEGATAAFTAAQNDQAACTAQLQSTREQFAAEVAGLSERLRRAEQEQTAAIQKKDGQLRDLQSALDDREQQLQKYKREGNTIARDKDIEIGRLEALVTDLQDKIRAIKPETFDPRAILTKSDGRILRAIPGSDVVYVNLGSADKIKPGMGFEIYEPGRPPGEDLRGKASIEVVTVMDNTSECRVTRRSAAHPIVEGDSIVNIAFERGRKPKFVVRGDFDLNYDGVTDYNGVDQVVSLIRQWGGQVAEELDESTDYLVVGLPPTTPAGAAEGKGSEVVRDQAQQKEFERSRFRAEVERAQKLFIPVITQGQFLFLTGYAGESVVAQRP